jgi:hypothetical protein
MADASVRCRTLGKARAPTVRVTGRPAKVRPDRPNCRLGVTPAPIEAEGLDLAPQRPARINLRAVLRVRSRRGRRRSDSGFALRVDPDRSARWRRHLHAMLIAAVGVCNIPIVQAG